ncbi:MAG: hypothetical protein NC048_02155, partial [Bacteroides sp.]|nr:hypothetical protein [Ruminococcus flavefaciens]MCM1554283.1 hypothetical protein [Bacteroides sp.]
TKTVKQPLMCQPFSGKVNLRGFMSDFLQKMLVFMSDFLQKIDDYISDFLQKQLSLHKIYNVLCKESIIRAL